jgi:hypothetical protein
MNVGLKGKSDIYKITFKGSVRIYIGSAVIILL